MSISANQVGVTRSARTICQPTTIDGDNFRDLTAGFTAEDHFDAYATFEFYIAKELATVGRDSPRLEIYAEMAALHKDELGHEVLSQQMTCLCLTTIFDVIRFGKSRANRIFP